MTTLAPRNHAEEIIKINLKIEAIDCALESFVAVDEDTRRNNLRNNFINIPYLTIYFRYSEEQLHTEKHQLNTEKHQLYTDKKQLQNLQIEAEKAKQRSTTKGNKIFPLDIFLLGDKKMFYPKTQTIPTSYF